MALMYDMETVNRAMTEAAKLYATCKSIRARRVLDIFASMKPVEVDVAAHARNVTTTHPSDMFICSACGFSCEITEIRYGDDGVGEPDAYEYECKRCPDCGAIMDGRREE